MEEIKKESRASRTFCAGFSSAVASFITYPLEGIKIKMQIHQMTALEFIKENCKKKAITGTYNGAMAATTRALLQSSLRFELYEEAKRRDLTSSLEQKIVVATGSGAIAGFLAAPLVKVQLGTQNNPWYAYRSAFDGFRRLFLKEGIRGMFAGAAVSSIRGMMNSVGQFVLYDEIKTSLLRSPDIFENTMYTSVIASVAAGSAATLLQQPLEVVQITYMNATPGKFKNSADVFKNIARNYGVSGFYRGLGPGFLRIIPQTVITYVILEHLRSNYGEVRKIESEQNPAATDA